MGGGGGTQGLGGSRPGESSTQWGFVRPIKRNIEIVNIKKLTSNSGACQGIAGV